jgi:adenosylcobyric acid synthase
VLGICGGLQLLGRRLGPEPAGSDQHSRSEVPGLGLLPVATTYAADKRTEVVRLRFVLPARSAWAALDGLEIDGYDIRHGTSTAATTVQPVLGHDHGWIDGAVLGLACHGVLEDPAVVQALVGRHPVDRLEETLDALAAAVDTHLDTDLLRRLTGGLL